MPLDHGEWLAASGRAQKKHVGITVIIEGVAFSVGKSGVSATFHPSSLQKDGGSRMRTVVRTFTSFEIRLGAKALNAVRLPRREIELAFRNSTWLAQGTVSANAAWRPTSIRRDSLPAGSPKSDRGRMNAQKTWRIH